MLRTCVAIFIVFCSIHVSTQAQGVTTGSISGVVRDSAKTLQGATVKATNTVTGAVYGAYTRVDGRYTLRGLRPGRYTITVSFVGYKTSSTPGINVDVGETIEFSINLSSSVVESKAVTVIAEGDALFDRTKMGSGSSISDATITAAPTINRSISDFARLNPYTTQTETAGSDGLQGVSVLGVNSRFNNFQIDGAVSNDLFALGSAGTAGSQANSNFVSLDAIERLKVNVSPYDVRQNGFTGGLINAITRGGTNEYHGSVFFFGRNEALVGNSPDALNRPFEKFQDYQFGGRLGGPIVKDKLLFHVTAEARLRSTPVDVAINDPNALNNFAVPEAVFDQIIGIAKDQYGYDAGTYNIFNNLNNTVNVIARLDWNIDEHNKVQIRHNFTHAVQDRNLVRTNRTFSLSSRVNRFTSINNQTVAQWNAILGSTMANELRLSVTQTNDERVLSTDPFPEIRVQVGSGENIIFGPERSSQANALDQTLLSLTDDFTIFSGNHTITIGTHNELSRFNNLFIQDFMGSYQYPSVDAFADSSANSYQVSYANTAVTGTEMPRSNWWMMQVGLYVMDEWRVSERLQLTGGLRVDAPIFLSTPLENTTFAERFPGRSTTAVPQLSLLWAPRLGFNYDLTGDRTIQIRGGSGVFSGRVAAVWLSNQYTNTGVDIFRSQLGSFSSQSVIFDPATNEPVRWDLMQPPPRPGDVGFPGSPVNTSAINITDAGFKMPQVWRNTLAVDWKILDGLSLTLEGLYGAFFNQVTYNNINMTQSNRSWVVGNDTIVGVSPVDGRKLYAGTNADSLVASEFTQVIVMENRNGGHQYSISAQLNLSPVNKILPGLAASVSYTRGGSEDYNAGLNSTATSQWQFTDGVDPNEPEVSRSNFDIPHRFLANASYKIRWAPKVATTFGLYYSGQSGRPYSVSYVQDYNGDNAVGGNDLLYIPRPEDYDTRVVIAQPTGTDLRTKEQVWDQIIALVDANPILKEHQGRILPRNALREPWRHNMDLRITQQLPAFGNHTIDITWDIQNVLNLLNSSWGWQQYVNFQSFNLFGISAVNNDPFDDQGRLRMSYTEPVTNGQPGIYITDNFFSRWRMQLGIRYTF